MKLLYFATVFLPPNINLYLFFFLVCIQVKNNCETTCKAVNNIIIIIFPGTTVSIQYLFRNDIQCSQTGN